MTFYLMSITKFEEIDETIVVLGGLHCDWNDAGISWNPSSYGNIPYIILSSKHIWKPPMTLVNAVDILSPIEGNTDNLATIFSDGNVSLGLGGILSAKCTTDISKFPYDSQTCNLKFAVWGLSAETAVLIESSDPISMLFYTPNSNWNLTSYHSRAVIWNQEDKKKMNAFWKLIGSRLPWTRKDNIVTVVPITDEKPAICKTSSPHGNENWKDVEETLQIVAGISAFWTDGEFSWTPSSYGNAEYVIVPQTTVWTPKLVLLNSVGTLQPLGLGNELSVTINYNGSTTVSFGFGHDLANRLVDAGFIVFAGVLNFNGKGACELRNRNLRNLNVVQLNLTKTDEIEKAVAIVSEQCSATRNKDLKLCRIPIQDLKMGTPRRNEIHDISSNHHAQQPFVPQSFIQKMTAFFTQTKVMYVPPDVKVTQEGEILHVLVSRDSEGKSTIEITIPSNGNLKHFTKTQDITELKVMFGNILSRPENHKNTQNRMLSQYSDLELGNQPRFTKKDYLSFPTSKYLRDWTTRLVRQEMTSRMMISLMKIRHYIIEDFQ
ncbi:CHRNB2 [Mytilus edulis]|uniref:CHRNB2 n=1 Tax=Mytilus edulis TaxID=6550 RepID=A0A8S3RL48_MYTED|nr:CHRNB2 [Mytilus edulis]